MTNTTTAQAFAQQSKTLADLTDEARAIAIKDLAVLAGRNARFCPGDFIAFGEGRIRRGLTESDNGETQAVSYSSISDLRVAMHILTRLFPDHFKGATARDYIAIMRDLGATKFVLDVKFSIRIVRRTQDMTIKSITIDGGATEIMDRLAQWITTTLLPEANGVSL